ncbi:Sialin [Armadillidium vulgare]|nr:Sialin [Armadillidium vulgare]
MRVSLSVAIVAMTNSSNIRPHRKRARTTTTCLFLQLYNDFTKSAFAGAFYYGYILTNIIGGRAADYWGGRYVNGCSIILASLCMIASPAAAGVSSTLFVVIRILQGIAAGLGFPAMTSVIAKWYPRNERSKFAAFILASNQLGTVVSMGISGWLCGSEYLGGWPSVFYLFGSLGLIWGVFWFILIRENPASHPRISDQELKYIIKGCPPITVSLYIY